MNAERKGRQPSETLRMLPEAFATVRVREFLGQASKAGANLTKFMNTQRNVLKPWERLLFEKSRKAHWPSVPTG